MNSDDTPEPSGKSGPEDTTQALREKAREALSDAEVLLERGSPEATINRGYYAVFQIARAALLTEGESPDTHSGIIRRFGYHFVRTERVSEEVGSILTTAQSMRGEADYDAFSDFGREEAAELVEKANRFIEAVEGQVLSGQ
ncbi:HEPN domain-containing protein [Salinibacter sp.]|uniref:HEPN domain-containing protein n=1 Tax=Salinibacter sp. TaxID=2065818 RepID=UPI0021E7EB88|nr:HEPN domain-containing protein [Salinibacter sp.]